MTPEKRTELEQAAKDAYERLIPDTPGINKPNVTMSGIKRKAFIEALVALLASREAAVLEEAAQFWSDLVVKRHELVKNFSGGMRELGDIRNEEVSNIVIWLRQQAQERRA